MPVFFFWIEYPEQLSFHYVEERYYVAVFLFPAKG